MNHEEMLERQKHIRNFSIIAILIMANPRLRIAFWS